MKIMKKKLGTWLQKIGLYLAGAETVYTRPERINHSIDFIKCQCGHSMADHQPDPDGHGTLCLVCFALMRHKPEPAETIEHSEL